MINIRNIQKTYRSGEIEFKALKGISFDIEKGEFASIMGPSGSGKSTLMNVLGCLDMMDEGQYVLNGKDISKMKDIELAHIRNKEIGFVFQSFNLLSKLSLLDNVELPMLYAGIANKERRDKALAALEKVGLIPWMKHRPNEISGGQRQRVAIARAIANSPNVIMADEPTGNLDTKSSYDIMKIFQYLNMQEGATIVMITHEPDVAIHTSRVMTVKDGLIQSDGYVQNRVMLYKEGDSLNFNENEEK